MTDVFICRTCAGAGDQMTNCTEEGGYDLEVCYSCNGLGYTAEGYGQPKVSDKPKRAAIDVALEAIEAFERAKGAK